MVFITMLFFTYDLKRSKGLKNSKDTNTYEEIESLLKQTKTYLNDIQSK
jgi:hypothetical protein